MLERELFALLEGTADAAFTVDEQGVICSWNRAAEKLFGYRPSAVLHEPCAQLFRGRGALGTPVCAEPCSVLECAVARREIPNYDLEVRAQSGERIWVNISILVFHDERTHRHLVVHLARDISQAKKSEELTHQLTHLAKKISELSGRPDRFSPAMPLTEQERKVLRLLADGKDPGRVARELRISPRTLRNHLHHVNQKLHTRNRLEAVIHATRRGLI